MTIDRYDKNVEKYQSTNRDKLPKRTEEYG